MPIRTVPLGTPGKPIYTDPGTEALARRRKLAEELLAQAQAPVDIRSIPQGFRKLGEVFLRAKALERAREQEEQALQGRRDWYSQTLREGLSAYTGTPGQDAFGAGVAPVPGGLGNTPGTTPGGLTALAQVLMGNPDTAELGFETFIKNQPKEPKAPTVREFKEGGKIVTRRWNPNTRSWEDMGEAPRFESSTTGGVTPAQQANNAEIDAARRQVRALYPNLNRDEIARLTTEATATGRTNPDYDSTLATLLRAASQRKVGDDSEFDRLYRQWYGAVPAPIPEPVRPDLEALGGEPVESSMLGRSLQYLGLTGGRADTETPEAAPFVPRRKPAQVEAAEPARGRPMRGRLSGLPEPTPRTADNRVDADRLHPGQVYEEVDGSQWRWTGRNFVRVR